VFEILVFYKSIHLKLYLSLLYKEHIVIESLFM